MRILFDECTPRLLARHLPGHEVATVRQIGWAGKRNGELLELAEREFDVLLTVDQNMEHQQNIGAFDLAVVVIVAPNTRIPTLMPMMPRVANAIESARAGQIIRVA